MESQFETKKRPPKINNGGLEPPLAVRNASYSDEYLFSRTNSSFGYFI